MLNGSCLCGTIAYEADRLSGPIVHCHGNECRKAQSSHSPTNSTFVDVDHAPLPFGAAFSTTARVSREHFRWTRGADRLRHFESSKGRLRHFCSECGAHLMAEWVDRPTVLARRRASLTAVILRLGCLDSDPGSKPVAHIWMSESACWLDTTGDLPTYPEGYAG